MSESPEILTYPPSVVMLPDTRMPSAPKRVMLPAPGVTLPTVPTLWFGSAVITGLLPTSPTSPAIRLNVPVPGVMTVEAESGRSPIVPYPFPEPPPFM